MIVAYNTLNTCGENVSKCDVHSPCLGKWTQTLGQRPLLQTWPGGSSGTGKRWADQTAISKEAVNKWCSRTYQTQRSSVPTVCPKWHPTLCNECTTFDQRPLTRADRALVREYFLRNRVPFGRNPQTVHRQQQQKYEDWAFDKVLFVREIILYRVVVRRWGVGMRNDWQGSLGKCDSERSAVRVESARYYPHSSSRAPFDICLQHPLTALLSST